MAKGILWITPKNLKEITSIGKKHEERASHLHVTLQFGVEDVDFKRILGKEVKVKVNGIASDDKIEALIVELDGHTASLCNNEQAHMTISMKSGVKPFYSNEMLKNNPEIKKLNFEFIGVFEFFEFK